MISKGKKDYFYIILVGCIYSVMFIMLWRRAFLSVEITDEIHGIASIYNIYLGKKPVMTSWDYHTGWCLLTPVFAVYHFFNPNMEGIVGFFRIFYLIFVCLSTLIIAYLLYKKSKKYRVFVLALPIIFYVPHSMFQISYNSFTLYVMMLISTLLYVSEPEKKETFRYFIMGILMALGCISYPTLVFTALLLIAWIGWKNRKFYWKRKILHYAIGGGIISLLFFVWLFARGSWEAFVAGIHGMLTSPHELKKITDGFNFLKYVVCLPIVYYFFHSMLAFIFYFIAQMFVRKWSKGKNKSEWNIILAGIFLFVNLYVNRGMRGYIGFGALLALAASIIFSDKRELEEYGIFYYMLLANIFTYLFTSDVQSILIAVEVNTPFIFLIVCLFLSLYEKKYSRITGIYLSVLLSVAGLFQVYTYIYRDEPVAQLTERIESGIYKGLYTTAQRKEFVLEIEKEVKENIRPEEKICAVTREPMVYLMSGADICAPQTWDAQFLYRGYTSAAPLLDYFEAINEIPDVLIATNADIPDFYGNAKYEINSFIDEYYTLYYEKQIQEVTVYLWRKN